MNTFEVVMLKTDTNVVPVKYAVVECTIGSTLAASYVWLKCISYGMSTKEDIVSYGQEPDSSLLKGIPGEYVVTSLDKVSPYSRRTDISTCSSSVIKFEILKLSIFLTFTLKLYLL